MNQSVNPQMNYSNNKILIVNRDVLCCLVNFENCKLIKHM